MPDDTLKRDVQNPILFECAWEVANKVGGIYTVIKTKVPVTMQTYGDRYTLIGPLIYKTAPMEVETQEPTDPALVATLQSMRAQGVKCLYGRWLIEGAPRVLLFDTGSQYHRLDEWKADLWNLAGIPSPPNDHETNETIVFGYLVAWFLGEVRSSFTPTDLILAYRCSVCCTQSSYSCSRPLPRMAGRTRHPPRQKTSHRCYHRFYNTRNLARPLSLRWKCRFLQ